MTYPCEGLPDAPLFFGLVAIQQGQQGQQPLCIELSQVFEPVLSKPTAYDYLTLLHQRLYRSLQGECAFLSAQLPSPHVTSQVTSHVTSQVTSQVIPQSENNVRFHCKQISYLLRYHSLLFCSQLRFACPFPARIVDAFVDEVRLRESVCRSFPALFEETGSLERWHEP